MLAELPAVMPAAIERWILWVRRRRLAAGAAAALAVAATLALVVSARSDRPIALFDAPLQPAQTAEIRQALTLWNESLSVNAQGTQLFVSAARRKDLLLRLALAGLPHPYVPTMADVLQSDSNPLTPESIVDDRRRAGIEGDLIAGLRRIRGVADASVVIAPASSDPLGDDRLRAPPSASVQLIAQADAQLSPATIAGVTRFVASAYPMLSPERVTVVDGSGAVLSGSVAGDRAESKERRVQLAVQTALDAAFGPAAAVVRVSARSSEVSEAVQTTRITPHGLLGADTGRERGAEPGHSFEKERDSRRYAYDTVVSRSSKAAGSIARLSVAVFLNARRVEAAKAPAIAQLVRAAAGADLRAGDEVVVQAMPFAARDPVAIAAQPQRARGGVWIALLPAAVILGLLVWRRLSLGARGFQPKPEVRVIRATLDEEQPRTAAYLLRGLPGPVRERVLRSYEPTLRAQVEAHLLDNADE